MSIVNTDPLRGQYKCPTVFEFEIEYSQQHRDGGYDTVTWTREKKLVHVLARTLLMARATWEFDNIYPGQTQAPTILAVKPLCTVDLFCEISRGRSF